MLRTKRQSWITLWQPRSFVGLMSVYESNHLRFGRLLGGRVPAPGEQLVSRVPGDLALYIDGLERSRYTTTLRMTYWFDEIADPDLVVRVYHDAHLVEAMRCTHSHHHRVLKRFATDHGDELQQRWTRNLMLNKWLEYASERGHRFGFVELPAREPMNAGLG